MVTGMGPVVARWHFRNLEFLGLDGCWLKACKINDDDGSALQSPDRRQCNPAQAGAQTVMERSQPGTGTLLALNSVTFRTDK